MGPVAIQTVCITNDFLISEHTLSGTTYLSPEVFAKIKELNFEKN